MKQVKQGYTFTVPTGNDKNKINEDFDGNKSHFKLPLHVIQKLQSRNKKHTQTSIHDITGNNNNNNNNNNVDPIQNMINELIDRLCITKKYLSPTVLVDIIALIIRSYLNQELHIRLTQPLRHFIHSSFHPFGVALFPPRKSAIMHPLVFNDNIQFQPLTQFQLDNVAFKFSKSVFIGNDRYPTLILSTPISIIPTFSCLYIQSNKPCTKIRDITDEVLYIWKQNNAAFVFTRKRSNARMSRMQLFMITVSSINGKIFVSKLIDKCIKIQNGVDYRIFGAYYYTQSIGDNHNDDREIKNGFPSDNFLIVVGDLNIIITPQKCIPFNNAVNLQCLWYFPTENKLIGIERNQYHLVSVGFNWEKSELFMMNKYKNITGTGIRHYFYDSDTDMIVIYKQLMASSKFKNELIFLPVSSQLMISEK